MRRKHRREQADAELDITAFMNLMIVLVPVLLLSMVFTHISILDLNFPGGANAQPLDAENLQLQVALYNDYIRVSDNQGTINQRIPDQQGQHDYQALQAYLKGIKARVPDKRDIVLLAQPKTDYQSIVSAMDAMRAYPAVVAANLVYGELFPDISLGDAPPAQPQASPVEPGRADMKQSRRSRRMQRHYRRMHRKGGLNLVSLMDIFTILVFFLMVNSSDVKVLQTASNVHLPKSVAEKSPDDTLVIQVTPGKVIVQGRAVASVDEMADRSASLTTLHQELSHLRARKAGAEPEAGWPVTIMADRNTPYAVLKNLMQVCVDEHFRQVKLAVDREQAEAPAHG